MNSTTSGFFGPSGLLAALSPEKLPALSSSDPPEFKSLSANNSENTTISPYSENSRPPKKRKICDLQDPNPSYSRSGTYPGAGIIDGENKVRAGMSNLSEVHKMDLKDVDISPEDAAFAIDHIVESILSNLRNTDLTKTRLVSRRLNYFSSKQLEKKLKMIISLPSNFEKFGYYDDVTIMTNSGRHEKTLEALNDFLSILNRANINKFPCTSFNLYTDNLNGPYISKLFTYHGSHIKTLKLSLNYISRTTTEASVLNELKTVLVEQVPHLQCLELNAFISMNDRDQWHRHRSHHRRQTQTTENDATEIKPFVLPNLKSLNILGASFSIFEELMGAAVNLSSYVGHQNEFLNYFIQGPGISRLSLLKHLNIVPNKNELQLLDTIASLIEKNKNKQLQIQHLHLSLKCLYNSGELWPRASRVINDIFRSSAGSVREMYWEPIRFLHGVQIPVMPKVSELVLLAMPKDMLCFPIEKHYFPVGFVMAKVFPSLKSIILFNDDVPGFSLTTLLDLTNMEQVTSVRNVHFKKLDLVPTAEKELFSKVFANAKIMPD